MIRYPSLEAANKLVSGYLLPTIIKQTLQSGKKCFVDLGHHTMLGHLLSALKVQLKERMKVVRIRRQRTSVAISYGIWKHPFMSILNKILYYARLLCPLSNASLVVIYVYANDTALNKRKEGPCELGCIVSIFLNMDELHTLFI